MNVDFWSVWCLWTSVVTCWQDVLYMMCMCFCCPRSYRSYRSYRPSSPQCLLWDVPRPLEKTRRTKATVCFFHVFSTQLVCVLSEIWRWHHPSKSLEKLNGSNDTKDYKLWSFIHLFRLPTPIHFQVFVKRKRPSVFSGICKVGQSVGVFLKIGLRGYVFGRFSPTFSLWNFLQLCM